MKKKIIFFVQQILNTWTQYKEVQRIIVLLRVSIVIARPER
jgi:hypothetical protein